MSVVGFDIGNLNCYIAVARSGGIELVTNEVSDRCTPAIVSFNQSQRFVGSSAKSHVITNAKNTVTNIKRLIGRKYDDPYVQKEISLVPFEIMRMEDGSIGVKVKYLDTENVFSPEQLYAMLLTELKGIAETGLGKGVQDCVISVPSFFTDYQRRAVLSASQIAGLNCLKLLNETTAVALSYGLYKKDLPSVDEKPRHVAFVDIGHSACQVSICAFRTGKIKVLCTASDPLLGGRDFDYLLRDHFNSEFLSKYKMDASTKVRPWLRLLAESEKMKKLMSANARDLPLYIECFMNDVDVSTKINRTMMEDMSKSMLAQLRSTLEDALQASGLSTSDIFAVELVGGTTRIPAVKDVIQDVFKTEIFTTLNADEAVARGCAIQCAMLSPTFKVRDIDVEDATPYPIHFSWNSTKSEKTGEIELFPRNNSFPSSKMITLNRKEPFELSAFYKTDASIPHTEFSIGHFLITGVVPTSSGETPKVKVRVRLNIHGILTVASASMTEELPAVEEPKSTGEIATDSAEPMDTTQEADANTTAKVNGVEKTSDDTEQKDTKDEPMNVDKDGSPADKEGSPADKEGQDKTTEDSGVAENGKTADQTNPEDVQKKPKKRKTTKELIVKSTVPQLSEKELNMLIEKEMELIMQVKLEKQRTDAINAVEEYVYHMRDNIHGDLQDYILEQDREKFASLLSETEDWIYGEGEGQMKQVYVDKLAELKKIGQPISDRYTMHIEIPGAYESFGKLLTRYRKILDLYEKKDENYSHIEEAEMKKVQTKVDEGMAWLTKKMQEFGNTAKHQTPKTPPTEILAEKKKLESFCGPIVTKPKPKADPPPKTEDKENTKEGSTDKSKEETNEMNSENGNKEQEAGKDEEDVPTDGKKKDLEMEVD